uniref:Uncharacterized protein n=1 Tax=Anopheles minimus TaxID=112268 RepID=A0A182VZ76_9DIPT
MDCIKCYCGCDKLSKDELEVLLKLDKQNEFLNNLTARNIFRNMFYPDPADYEPQFSGSQNRPRAKPNAIKYLDYIEEAEMLVRTNNLSEEVVLEFIERVPVEKYDEREQLVKNSTETRRAEELRQIIEEYGEKLVLSKQYTQFKEKLKAAYQGKREIKKL